MPEIVQTSEYIIQNNIKIGAVDFRDPLIGTGKQALHIDWLPRKERVANRWQSQCSSETGKNI